jgi:hypothetical protein
VAGILHSPVSEIELVIKIIRIVPEDYSSRVFVLFLADCNMVPSRCNKGISEADRASS